MASNKDKHHSRRLALKVNPRSVRMTLRSDAMTSDDYARWKARQFLIQLEDVAVVRAALDELEESNGVVKDSGQSNYHLRSGPQEPSDD